jgi:ferritin-like metal-binding protein YciE
MSFLKTDKLEDVFHTELCDILDAEKRLTKALPKMAENASDPQLASGFRDHLAETEAQVSRLERIHEILDMKIKSESCDAMKGLVHEADELIGGTAKGPVRDAAMIAAAQKVEHYEIATYGTLISLARTLNYGSEVTSLLETTLEEEKGADVKLSALAEDHINDNAMRQAA